MARKKSARKRRAKQSAIADIVNALPKIFLMFLLGLIISTRMPDNFSSVGFAIHTPLMLVKPYEQSLPVGSRIIVNVETETLADAYAYQADVLYNSEILRLEKIQQGKFLSRDFADTTLYNQPDTVIPGVVRQAIESRTGPQGIDGSGTLLKLTFTILKSGESKILLNNVRMLDAQGELIPVATQEASVIGLEPPTTCQQLQGNTCSAAAACQGTLLDASDTLYCCSTKCMSVKQQPQSRQSIGIYKILADEQVIYREHEQRDYAIEQNTPFELVIVAQNQGSDPVHMRAVLHLPSAARLLSISPKSTDVPAGGFQTFTAVIAASDSFAGKVSIVTEQSIASAPFQVLTEQEVIIARTEQPVQRSFPQWSITLLLGLIIALGAYALLTSNVSRSIQLPTFRSTYIVDAPYLRQMVRFHLVRRYRELYVVEPYEKQYARLFQKLVPLKPGKSDLKKAQEIARRFGISPHLAKSIAVGLRKPRARILTAERLPPRLVEEYAKLSFIDVIGG